MFVSPLGQESAWRPPVDIYRVSWGWILKFELAGVRIEDVNVHVSSNTVTVRGVRRDYMVEEGCCHYAMEISYSNFDRSVELPDDLGSAKVRVDYRDGILFLRIALAGEGA